eukprot:365228-Chlamydomonas_euryale.AAC.12
MASPEARPYCWQANSFPGPGIASLLGRSEHWVPKIENYAKWEELQAPSLGTAFRHLRGLAPLRRVRVWR